MQRPSGGTIRLIVPVTMLWIVPATVAAQVPPASPTPAVSAVASDQVPAPPPAPASARSYKPPTLRDRLDWTVFTTVGPTAWAGRCLSATWFTSWDSPSEWGRSVSGIGKRFGDHLASTAVSNAMEAGLGAIWGEDPRYTRMGGRRVRARIGNVFNDLFSAPYPDGRRHFAPARLVAAFGNNVVEDLWLPPSTRDWRNTFARTGYAYLAHLAGDAFAEFWPDLHRWLGRKLASKPRTTQVAPVERDPAQRAQAAAVDRAVRVLERSLIAW